MNTVRVLETPTAASPLEGVTASGVVWRLGRWRDGAAGVGAPDADAGRTIPPPPETPRHPGRRDALQP